MDTTSSRARAIMVSMAAAMRQGGTSRRRREAGG